MSAGRGLNEDSPSRFESETSMELAKVKCRSATWELSRLCLWQTLRDSRSAAATSSLFADSVVETPLVWSSITTLAGEDLSPLCLPRPPLHSMLSLTLQAHADSCAELFVRILAYRTRAGGLRVRRWP